MKQIILTFLFVMSATLSFAGHTGNNFEKRAAELLRKQILQRADEALNRVPETVTNYVCERSAGGKHDFYSEGDYWWPDPKNPDGPYIQRDGMSNPGNFTAHRLAMIRFSKIVGILASAYKITGDEKYVKAALVHLKAWFVDTTTRMNPSLNYSQAIKGRYTGRGIGIIDTIQLLDVVQGIITMETAGVFDSNTLTAIKSWFAEYLEWLTTSKYGHDEMNAKNNHGTCWTMQVAAFAKLTGDTVKLEFCRNRFETVLLPDQMAEDGSFPLELKRTKPFGYSIFNLDAMTTLCRILTDKDHDEWAFQTPDGKNIKKGIAYLAPYLADKSKWPFQHDVMYWENWPVAQTSLIFGAEAYNNENWYQLWASLDHFPEVEEVIRNFPVRNPIIWL